jgi:hypothetical protein
VADDVSGANVEVVQQTQGIFRVLGECHGSHRIGP